MLDEKIWLMKVLSRVDFRTLGRTFHILGHKEDVMVRCPHSFSHIVQLAWVWVPITGSTKISRPNMGHGPSQSNGDRQKNKIILLLITIIIIQKISNRFFPPGLYGEHVKMMRNGANKPVAVNFAALCDIGVKDITQYCT